MASPGPAEIRCGALRNLRIVAHEPKRRVAVPAQQATHVTTLVAMVDYQLVGFAAPGGRVAATCAQPALSRGHRFIFSKSDAVQGSQVVVPPRPTRAWGRIPGVSLEPVGSVSGRSLLREVMTTPRGARRTTLHPASLVLGFHPAVDAERPGAFRVSLLPVQPRVADLKTFWPARPIRSSLFHSHRERTSALGTRGTPGVGTSHLAAADAATLFATGQHPGLVMCARRQGVAAY